MCRKPADVCSELGAHPDLWPSSQPLPTPSGAAEAAEAVRTAVRFAREGDVEASRKAILAVAHEPLRDWFIDHAQLASRFRAAVYLKAPISPVPKQARDRAYPDAGMERQVYERDLGLCRYCGIPVQLRQDLRLIRDVVGEQAFPMGRTNHTRSGAMIIARASADHFTPVNQGGRTVPENLVTACWPCQFGKSSFTPEQLGLVNPLKESDR